MHVSKGQLHLHKLIPNFFNTDIFDTGMSDTDSKANGFEKLLSEELGSRGNSWLHIDNMF